MTHGRVHKPSHPSCTWADPLSRQNGHYPDPSLTSALPLKRSLRDPYGNWWDPQERRNYGEPVHEDNDILGAFSTEEYTHFTPAWGVVLWGTAVASILGLSAVCWRLYPDKVCVYTCGPILCHYCGILAMLTFRNNSLQRSGRSPAVWRPNWAGLERRERRWRKTIPQRKFEVAV